MDQRVKVENTKHTFEMGISGGLKYAVSILEELPENLKSVPGFQLALAKIQAAAAERSAASVSRNLALLARNGVDVATHRAVSYDPATDELICELYSERDG